MKRVLLDEGMPVSLAASLSGPALRVDAFPNGWKGTRDGALLRRVGAQGCNILLTRDANMVTQQNLQGHTVGVVVLRTGRVQRLHDHVDGIADSILHCPPGRFLIVEMDGSRFLTFDEPGSGAVGERLPSIRPFDRALR